MLLIPEGEGKNDVKNEARGLIKARRKDGARCRKVKGWDDRNEGVVTDE